MNIKIVNLTFKREHTKRRLTKRIVVHHSASAPTTTVYDIQTWHHNRGWYGIGYHYVIYADGTIVQGRPEWAVGAHAYQDAKHEANSDGIGICLVGNFQTSKPTEPQMASLVELINNIKTRYAGLTVVRHSDVQATACPGALFPWADLTKRLEGGKPVEDWMLKIMKDAEAAKLVMPGVHAAEEPAPKWFVLAVALNVLKVLKGE